MHLWRPQGKGLPQARPQLKLGCEQGMVLRCSWFPWQNFVVNIMQGGQVAAEWQLC